MLNQNHLMISGPVLSLKAKCPHYDVVFSISVVCSGILHVTFPHTTQPKRINSSYFDQIVYTFVPYVPPFMFKSFKKSDGCENDVAPGKNPSLVLHVGKAVATPKHPT